MKLKASKEQLQGDFLEVSVKDWRGRLKKRLLPREGWEELEKDLWLLSSTRNWVRPLFLRRENGTFTAFEGEENEKAKNRS